MSFSTIKIKFAYSPMNIEFIENFVTNRTTINQVTTPSTPGVQTTIQYFNSIYTLI